MAIQLDVASLPAGPMPLLAGWFGEARGAGLAEPRAMVLGTADPEGVPSAPTVLATVIDDSGVTFHSSHPTRKTRDLARNPRACAVFGWYDIGGPVGAGPAAAADTRAGTAHERIRYALGGGSWHRSRELP